MDHFNMQINLSHRGQTRGANTGVWHGGTGVTRGPCSVQHKGTHLPPEPISQLLTFVQPAWRAPVPSQPCTALRSRGHSSRSQENRKSLLSAGGWAATQSHHLCLSSAASASPLHSLPQHQLHRLTSPALHKHPPAAGEEAEAAAAPISPQDLLTTGALWCSQIKED